MRLSTGRWTRRKITIAVLASIGILAMVGTTFASIAMPFLQPDPDDLPAFSSAAPLQRNLSVVLGLVLVLELAATIITRTASMAAAARRKPDPEMPPWRGIPCAA